jgi:hypothetical protein
MLMRPATSSFHEKSGPQHATNISVVLPMRMRSFGLSSAGVRTGSAQAHQVGLAAVLQIEAALLLVVGDEGVLLARDGLIAEAQATRWLGSRPTEFMPT